MTIVDFILLLIFSIPLYWLLIWLYIEPEDSFLMGRRWMYNEEPELSEEAIEYYKKTAIIGIGVLSIVIVVSFIRLIK